LKIYRRSIGARTLSLGSLLFFAALEAYHLATGGSLLSRGGWVLGILLLLCAAASLLNLGDRYRIDEQGIFYANPILSRLGLKVDRGVSWPEVVSVRARRGLAHGSREATPSALFLELRSGRPFVIDSVEAFEEVRQLISIHLGRKVADISNPPIEWRTR
jgi:hypothetical protein